MGKSPRTSRLKSRAASATALAFGGRRTIGDFPILRPPLPPPAAKKRFRVGKLSAMEEDVDDEEDVLPELERCETLARAHEETNAGIFRNYEDYIQKNDVFSACSLAPLSTENMCEKYARPHFLRRCAVLYYCYSITITTSTTVTRLTFLSERTPSLPGACCSPFAPLRRSSRR